MPRGREAKLVKMAKKTPNGSRKLNRGNRSDQNCVDLVNEAQLEEAEKRAGWLVYKRAIIEARVAEYLKNKNK